MQLRARPEAPAPQQTRDGEAVAGAQHAAGAVLAQLPPGAPLEPTVLREEHAASAECRSRQGDQGPAGHGAGSALGEAQHPEVHGLVRTAERPGVQAYGRQEPEQGDGLDHAADDAHLELPVQLKGHGEDATRQVLPVHPIHEEEGDHRDRQDRRHQEAQAECSEEDAHRPRVPVAPGKGPRKFAHADAPEEDVPHLNQLETGADQGSVEEIFKHEHVRDLHSPQGDATEGVLQGAPLQGAGVVRHGLLQDGPVRRQEAQHRHRERVQQQEPQVHAEL
mmetsp:Transcript_106572/g.318476  ORF Transcript_106572/g.318476 Transcript_106572/m.318476 type:complete len:278 (-) Transcript_106572:1515-2348(-)